MEPAVFSLVGSARRLLAAAAITAIAFGGSTRAAGPVIASLASQPLVGQPIHVPLTVGTFGEERTANQKTMYLKLLSARGSQALQTKPAALIKSEPNLESPTYYRIPMDGRDVLAILDIGQKGEKATLYIDFDGQGLFAQIKGFEGVDQYKGRNIQNNFALFNFGPITLPKTADTVTAPVQVTVSCQVMKRAAGNFAYLRVSPQNFVIGALQLGSGQYAVAFVDSALKGRFEPQKSDSRNLRQAMRNGASMIAIDLDQNGAFDYKGEISPLLDLVRIDGKYYHVTVAPDGSEAQFQEAKPELGVFDTKCPGMTVFMVSDQCAALLTPNTDGKWKLPVGRYTVQSFALAQTVGDTKWTLAGSRPAPAMNAVNINSATPAVFTLGPPLVLSYSLDRANNVPGDEAVSIGLTITGKGGETYSAGAEKNQSMQPAPRFAINSEAGDKLTEGEFEYG